MAVHNGHYVYIIQEREFLDTTNVIKVGFSTDLPSRMRAYPKSSQILMTLRVSEGRVAERTIMDVFLGCTKCASKRIRHRSDIGQEYFEVDGLQEAVLLFAATAAKFVTAARIVDEDVDEEDHRPRKRQRCGDKKDAMQCVLDFFKSRFSLLAGKTVAADALYDEFLQSDVIANRRQIGMARFFQLVKNITGATFKNMKLTFDPMT